MKDGFKRRVKVRGVLLSVAAICLLGGFVRAEEAEGEGAVPPVIAAPGSEAEEPASEAKKPTIPAPAREVPHDPAVFRPDPSYEGRSYEAGRQLLIYGDKHWNETERPLLELGRRLYTEGPFRKASEFFGKKNLAVPSFMAFGDWRTGLAYNDNGGVIERTLATRLNLDLDWRLTATERFHAFVRPLDENGQFTRLEFRDASRKDDLLIDADPDALFFEGDLGPILSGMSGENNRLDLPFALGLMPLLFQNGVWVEDAFTGIAVTVPSLNSPALDISNADITFFAAFDKVSSPALVDRAGLPDDHHASIYGVTGFLEANRGYWELGLAYVDGRGGELRDLDYENVSVAFTRRYRGVLSNSVRLIGNFGQHPEGRARTADGFLLLVENSLVTRKPLTFLPYFNVWLGKKSPQSLARDVGAGGVLKNTGMLFETDGLTGFPKLDDTGHDTYGAAFGLEYLFSLDRQIVTEVVALNVIGEESAAPARGSQYGVEVRYQHPLGHGWIFRADSMVGWRENQDDLSGIRIEVRRKF